MFVVWLIGRIFQFQSFMADVPQVTVTAVTGICSKRKVNAVCAAVFNLGFTGIHVPFVVSPRSDDLDIRSESFDTEFETDLVISLSGCTVADSDSAFFAGNFHKTFGDNRTSHGSTKQIFIFIDCMTLNTRNDVFVTEFIDNIFDVEFGSTTCFCTLVQSIKFASLSTVDADADNFIIIIFLQPWNDRCRIQTAGISKNNFFLHN